MPQIPLYNINCNLFGLVKEMKSVKLNSNLIHSLLILAIFRCASRKVVNIYPLSVAFRIFLITST